MAVATTQRPFSRARAHAVARAPAVAALALAAIAAISVLLRTTRLDVGFWIDEGLSVGIADRPLGDIPSTLRLDGSPPLYYMLLHVWMHTLGGTSESSTHALSVLFATLAIPITWALVRALMGARAGWIAAVLVALNPFLTAYAQETRMYALVILLGLTATCCFLGTFVFDRGRGWLAGFAVAYAALLYTHNWALFAGAGLAAGWLALYLLAERDQRKRLLRNGLLAAAGVLVLYLPWIPNMLFQTAHTGAPWAKAPTLAAFTHVPERLLGGVTQWLLLIGAGAGLAVLWRRPFRRMGPEGRAALVLAIAAVVTVLLPWLASQEQPAWATRYLAAGLPSLSLLGALGLSRAGVLGIAVLALSSVLWLGQNGPAEKSNVRDVAQSIAPGLRAGDLVISTQPEQAPVLHYYLRGVPGLRWASITGPLTDLGVTDWRDGTERLRATSVQRDLLPLLDTVKPGQRVALVQPEISSIERWSAPWTSLVRQRSASWLEWMRNDPRFRVVSVAPETPATAHPNPVRATILVRDSMR